MAEAIAATVQDTPEAVEVPKVSTEEKLYPEKKVEVETPKVPEEPAKPVVPEKYELKLPEGSKLEATHVEKIATYAKERGLSQEDAQKELDRDHLTVSDYVNKQQEYLKQTQSAWVQMAKSDKEIGGQGFDKNLESAKRVVNRFGTDAFKRELDATGLGNHPELIRVFSRIGKMMSEDQLVIPGSQQTTGKKALEDIFYGSSKK